MLNRRNSSLLELEAADYFKLDTCQVDLLTRSNQRLECLNDSKEISNNKDDKNSVQRRERRWNDSKTHDTTRSKEKRKQQDDRTFKPLTFEKQPIKCSEIHHTQDAQIRLYKTSPNRCRSQLNSYQTATTSNRGYSNNSTSKDNSNQKDSLHVRGQRKVSPKRTQRFQKSDRFGNMANENHHKITVTSKYPPHQQDDIPVIASLPHLANSSTTSTSSLPSISSSPSLSPTLVCPHTSLDDLLTKDKYGAKSPHTIGLCDRCRLNPPRGVQSPLSPQIAQSPVFKPLNSIYTNYQYLPRYDLSYSYDNSAMKRGYSDHQVSLHKKAAANAAEQDKNCNIARLSSSSNIRDDSLDYFLDPRELRRLQLSPTLRNSVGYIRNNSIEAGRVVKIYQNGKPFDKPLRICICRNEFSNLNHLLDYINGRQLIPSGARYLFHMDGQLVYSVHELKHGSAYIVSGTRNFDTQACNIVKEQQKRELFRQHQFGTQKQSTNNNRIGDKEEFVKLSSNIELMRREPGEFFSSQKQAPKEANSTKVTSFTSRRADINPKVSTREFKVLNRPKAMVQEKHPSKLTNYKASPRTEAPVYDQPFSKDSLTRSDASLNTQSLETINMSRSDDNLIIDRVSSEDIEKPVTSFVRAKSEMSAAGPSKRKKNVTFKDTGRGSSPLISYRSMSNSNSGPDNKIDPSVTGGEVVESTSVPMGNMEAQTSPSRGQIKANEMKALHTNEIGIQVSDSIEGFLIDLPLPVPEKREGDEKRVSYLRKGGGVQASGRVNSYTNTSPKRFPKRTTTVITRQTQGKASKSISRQTTTGVGSNKKRKQIVTISERQLSLDEINQLKDMDHGDHHHEPHKVHRVTIKLESMDDSSNKTEESLETIQEIENDVKSDKTMALDKIESDSSTYNDVTEDLSQVRDGNETSDHLEGNEKHWEYPGGRVASATPTERPVSQSEANESVHARVITPTPSLSTQDNISLSGSIVARNDSQFGSLDGAEHKMVSRAKLPVIGMLRNGIEAPSKNFKLVWVNGFAINDQYPENSATALGTQSLLDGSWPTTSSTKSSNKAGSSLLSPSSSNKLKLGNLSKGSLIFKPSERFHNWVCYSNKYDELIYPTGNLVVLWCRWTNEQRYYSKHTSNISCITLASLDDDLIGSAQVSDSNANINSLIHLWSLGSLETLFVVDQDHFKLQKIFSLKVRNTQFDGCQLSIGAKDDKRIWFYRIHLKLDDKGQQDVEQLELNAKAKHTRSKQQQMVNKLTVIKSDKILQTNHIPLLVMRMSNAQNGADSAKTSATDSKLIKSASGQLDNLVLSFGRRHFQIWALNQRQEQLRLLQCEEKSAQFIGTIVKANCLARMSPSEYVVGDSDGSINLLIISVADGKPPTSLLSSSDSSIQKYRIETVLLLKSSTNTSDREQGTPGPSPTKLPSITCLARISGNLFASSDSNCTIKIWRIVRKKITPEDAQQDTSQSSRGDEKSAIMKISNLNSQTISCNLISCITLPNDLGFICSIVLAKYNRRMALVEFYVASTSNAILFGSIKLDSANAAQIQEDSMDNNASSNNHLSTFSVVYEGHESSASNLVADYLSKGQRRSTSPIATNDTSEFGEYFTCSLDCKICKWSGRNLIWKSMLPSACTSIAVHPIGFVLAIGSGDGTVYILDKTSGLLISYFPLTPVCINCLAYSRDGTYLAAGCANGSIFILPVYERGLKYKKVSIFQSPYPVVSLQFSTDNQYILTSVTHSSYQELILWDLPNFRYMRDNVKIAADKIQWYDAICSGSEDVRAIWENENIASIHEINSNEPIPSKRRLSSKRLSTTSTNSFTDSTTAVVNLSCHRLIRDKSKERGSPSEEAESFVIASDLHGYIRLFKYPCYDIQQAFYETRISSLAVNCCRFLSASEPNSRKVMFVSSSIDGTICLWTLI